MTRSSTTTVVVLAAVAAAVVVATGMLLYSVPGAARVGPIDDSKGFIVGTSLRRAYNVGHAGTDHTAASTDAFVTVDGAFSTAPVPQQRRSLVESLWSAAVQSIHVHHYSISHGRRLLQENISTADLHDVDNLTARRLAKQVPMVNDYPYFPLKLLPVVSIAGSSTARNPDESEIKNLTKFSQQTARANNSSAEGADVNATNP